MNKSLTRSIGFWLLLVVSLATTAVGAWLISGQIATMTTTLLDGTATGIEVYVGQSLVVVGAGVLAAGIVGVLLTLGLVAARSLVPAPVPAVEAIDWTAERDETPATTAQTTAAPAVSTVSAPAPEDEAGEPAPEKEAEPESTPAGGTEAEKDDTAPAITR